MKLTLIAGLLFMTAISSVIGKHVVCYAPNWLSPSWAATVDTSLCTMYLIAFGVLSNGKIDGSQLNGLEALKTPTNKLLLSLGGWNAGPSYFTDVASTPEKRIAFAENVKSFLVEKKLDGIDIDWEYPTGQDLTNFPLLMQQLKTTLGSNYLVTAAVHCTIAKYNNNVEDLGKALDYIFIMSYDLHGNWDAAATGLNFNAPLNPTHTDGFGIVNQMKQWIGAGVPASKLMVGVPYYGLQYTMTGSGTTPNSPTSGCQVIVYNTVCSNFKSGSGWTVAFDNNAATSYMHQGTTWISMESPQSIRAKADLANSLNLAGAFTWSLDQDDSSGNCLNVKYPLTRELVATVMGYAPSPTTPGPSTTAAPTTAPAPTSTSGPDPTLKYDEAGKILNCKEVGLFANPKDCAKFNNCVYVGSPAMLQDCAPTTFWNQDLRSCGYDCKFY
jgi:chitinase